MSARTSSVQSAIASTSRLVYLDHLRAALVILVVLHHVAMVYGGIPPFYYLEPPTGDTLAGLASLGFVLLNQAWFMGAFFLLAGYFTPGSFDRRGPTSFLGGRLLRLGIPLLVFALVLNPLSVSSGFFLPGELGPLTRDTFSYIDSIGMGPMWFVAMLLIFSFGYVLWRGLAEGRGLASTNHHLVPGYGKIAAFVVLLAVASYLMRMWIPIGRELAGFPTLSYFPQYLSLFAVGALAYRRNWLRSLPATWAWCGLASAVAASVILFPLAFSGDMFSLDLTAALGNAMGDGHWQSAVYALWDSVFAIGVCLHLVALLSALPRRNRPRVTRLAGHSYAVYIIHIPVVVFLAVAAQGVELGPLAKFGVISAIAVPLCFVIAWLVRKIPLIAKVV
jgi:glucan biosynthesis protein C